MTDPTDRFWRQVRARLDDGEPAVGWEEAEQRMAYAGEEPLSPARIDAIVAQVTAAPPVRRDYRWVAALLLAPVVGFGFFKAFDAKPEELSPTVRWDYPTAVQRWMDASLDEAIRRNALNRVYSYVDEAVTALLRERDERLAGVIAAEAGLRDLRGALGGSGEIGVAVPIAESLRLLTDTSLQGPEREALIGTVSEQAEWGLSALGTPATGSLEDARQAVLEALSSRLRPSVGR